MWYKDSRHKKVYYLFLLYNRKKGEKDMGRPKGGTNTTYSKAEKLSVVMRNLNGESGREIERDTGIHHSLVHSWVKQYRDGGENSLENSRKPGNPLAKYENKKALTPFEQLEFENAQLKQKVMKQETEIILLKKLQELQRGDAGRRK